MTGRIILTVLDSGFSKKDHGNDDLVLHEVRTGGRFSTFEMTQTLMNTLNTLVTQKKIKDTKGAYPWHTYEPLPEAEIQD